MKVKFLAALTMLALVLSASTAQASNLRMDINGVLVLDGGGGDANVNPDAITWVGGVAGWSLIVNTGQGESSYAGGAGSMDLNYVATGNGSSVLTILLSQQPGSTYPGWRLSIGGTQVASITSYSAWVGAAQFAQTTQIDGTLTAGGSPFALVGAGAATVAPGYWLTQRIVITPTGGTTSVSGDADLIPLPEPSSLLLLGTGLLGLGGYARRRYLGQ